MKVWELEEGKEYISKGLKFKTENSVLRYYVRSSLGYNVALELDFTEEGEA